MIASLLGCSTWRVATLQLSVQSIILFYAHGLLEFSAFAPTAPPVDSTSKEVVAGAVAAPLPQKFLDKRPRATMSVVLPCLNEPYAYKTVMKFCDRTPPEVRLGKLPNDFFAVTTFDQHEWIFVIFRLGFMSCCWEHWTNCEDYGFTCFTLLYLYYAVITFILFVFVHFGHCRFAFTFQACLGGCTTMRQQYAVCSFTWGNTCLLVRYWKRLLWLTMPQRHLWLKNYRRFRAAASSRFWGHTSRSAALKAVYVTIEVTQIESCRSEKIRLRGL